MIKEELFMDGKEKNVDDFVSGFDMLRGKLIKISDYKEISITGVVDREYDIASNKNYRLLNAELLMSSKKEDFYVGEFNTIKTVYTLSINK